MNPFYQLLQKRLLTEHAAAKCGQLACFFSAMAVLVLAVRKLAALPLSEGEQFIGFLAALACTLLMVVIGLVLPLAARADQKPGP